MSDGINRMSVGQLVGVSAGAVQQAYTLGREHSTLNTIAALERVLGWAENKKIGHVMLVSCITSELNGAKRDIRAEG